MIADQAADAAAPSFRYAGHGARLAAWVIDIFLMTLVTAALMAVVFAATSGRVDEGPLNLFGAMGASIASTLYFPLFWAATGWTPGMRALGLRVVRERDGGRVGPIPALVRLVGYSIDVLGFFLGFAWILIDRRRRGWHDLLAATVVIQER
jgi:uncharacterized RDD family membrane protein YckC